MNSSMNATGEKLGASKEFNLERHLTAIGINIVNVNCTHCGKSHSDKDEWCYKPHSTHLCEHCGEEFTIANLPKSVSNPVLTDA